MKLTIYRDKWARGRSSTLRDNRGNMCCLGFFAIACGIPESEIVHSSTPISLAEKGVNLPAPYDRLVGQSDISSNRFYLTGLCRKLIAENDRSYHCVGHLPVLEYETEAARERVITRHFLELGVEVTFEDGTHFPWSEQNSIQTKTDSLEVCEECVAV